MTSREALLGTLNDARDAMPRCPGRSGKWTQLRDRSLFAAEWTRRPRPAFNVAAEPKALRERYGQNVNGMSLLLARQLVEVGVPLFTGLLERV